MGSITDRFLKDIEGLISLGGKLRYSLLRAVDEKRFMREFGKHFKKEEHEALLKTLPDFKEQYEAWYSESLALIKQVLPDRVGNFVALYEKPKRRAELDVGSYVIQDFLQGLKVVREDGRVIVDYTAAVPQFDQQLAILRATKARFKSSLFEIRQLVRADIFDSELGAARALHAEILLRPAGVLAGVVLERHLRQVCESRNVAIKNNATLSELSGALKSSGTIDLPQWRHLSFLADIRNICAHDKQKEPTSEQVNDLLNGAEKVIKTIF